MVGCIFYVSINIHLNCKSERHTNVRPDLIGVFFFVAALDAKFFFAAFITDYFVYIILHS